MTDNSLLDRLARESRQAAIAARESLPAPEDRNLSPVPGSIWALPEVDSSFVLVQRDPANPERFLAVPADHRRQVGSRDVLVEEGEREAPLVMRCSYPLWLNRRQLDAGANAGRIDEASVFRALQILHGNTPDHPGDHPERIDVDQETAYQDWNEQGPGADRQRVLERAKRTVRLPLAAAIASLLILGTWLVSQRFSTDPIPEATLVERGPEITIGDTLRGTEPIPLPTRKQWRISLYWTADAPSYPAYRVELSEKEGRRIASWDLTEEDREEADLAVLSNRLKVGVYRLLVLGISGGIDGDVDGAEEVVIQEHYFRFVAPRDP